MNMTEVRKRARLWQQMLDTANGRTLQGGNLDTAQPEANPIFSYTEWCALHQSITEKEVSASLDGKRIMQSLWRDLREKIEKLAPFTKLNN